jgi:hypothetical protein
MPEYISLLDSSDEEESSVRFLPSSSTITAPLPLHFYLDGIASLTPYAYDTTDRNYTKSQVTGAPCLTIQQILGPLLYLKSGILSAMCIDWDWLIQDIFMDVLPSTCPLLFITDSSQAPPPAPARSHRQATISQHPLK